MKKQEDVNEKFNKSLERLNVLYGNSIEHWKLTVARKEHIDEFGEVIAIGDSYFKRELGIDSYQKLSRQSMEKLLWITVQTNLRIQKISDHLIELSNKELNEAAKKMPVL